MRCRHCRTPEASADGLCSACAPLVRREKAVKTRRRLRPSGIGPAFLGRSVWAHALLLQAAFPDDEELRKELLTRALPYLRR